MEPVMSDIPFARLGVSPASLPDAPRKVRLAIARGVVPLPPGEQMGALYVLAVGEDEEVRKSAIATMQGIRRIACCRPCPSRRTPRSSSS